MRYAKSFFAALAFALCAAAAITPAPAAVQDLNESTYCDEFGCIIIFTPDVTII